MTQPFEMDSADLKKLERFMKRAPKFFLATSAEFLSMQAFQTRENAIREIHTSMIRRNKGLAKTMTRFKPARAVALRQQKASTFSLKKGNFTGWEEQQDGVKSPAKRIPTVSSRTGSSKTNRVAPRNRLSSSTQVERADGYQGRHLEHRETHMIRRLSRRNYKGLMRISGRGLELHPGMYRFSRGTINPRRKARRNMKRLGGQTNKNTADFKRIKMVQDLDPKNTQQKRNVWLSRARDKTNRGANVKLIWAKAFDRTMARKMERLNR
jgi:hypothetical protein